MKWLTWSKCIPALIISIFMVVPQNMIGCGPSMDPYDYFTTFFSKATVDEQNSRPFLYTSLLTFYDDWDNYDSAAGINDKIINEWQQYGGTTVKKSDAEQLIYKTSVDDIKRLQNNFTGTGSSMPFSLKNNSLALALVDSRKRDALKYLILAKTIEPYCSSTDQWSSALPIDSIAFNKYLELADQEGSVSLDKFIKDKYAFLKCKIAFYNNRSNDCINTYNAYFNDDKSTPSVKGLALSYKAGALFRLGKNKYAAYAFSQAFGLASTKQKKAVFLGFFWATESCNPELLGEYTSLAKTDKEKAVMTAMFGLYGTAFHLGIIEKVFALDPACELLPLLGLREINKVEEQYLTPKLSKQPGDMKFYYTWNQDVNELHTDHVKHCITVFEKIGASQAVSQRNYFTTGAAYLSYISGDYNKALSLLKDAEKGNGSTALKDQQKLIELLVKASNTNVINTAAENSLLPSILWLQQKTKQQPEYGIFYRNFFSQVIAPAYYRQGDVYKAALAYGAADKSLTPDPASDSYYRNTGNSIEFLQNKMNTNQLTQLYKYLDNAPASNYDKFLITNSLITKDDVIDMLGTSYMRDFDFTKAIAWLSKNSNPVKITEEVYYDANNRSANVNINPFHDYLNDWQRYEKPVSKPYTKLSFAQKMLELEKAVDTAKGSEAKAKLYYQLASGFYNMSYYGNSWITVVYYRPTSDWNDGSHTEGWQKEYFCVSKAKAYYTKAYELSTNKEFKAAAFFLAAKCAQRQVPRPRYNWRNEEGYKGKREIFEKRFRNNPMFTQFKKEFGTTKFYQYAYTRCSYLRDFVKQ